MFRLSGGDGGADLFAESGGHYGHQNRRRKIHETLGNPAEIHGKSTEIQGNPGKSMEIWILNDFKMDLNGKNQGTSGFSNKPWLPEDN